MTYLDGEPPDCQTGLLILQQRSYQTGAPIHLPQCVRSWKSVVRTDGIPTQHINNANTMVGIMAKIRLSKYLRWFVSLYVCLVQFFPPRLSRKVNMSEW
jgi:hypothetical protein